MSEPDIPRDVPMTVDIGQIPCVRDILHLHGTGIITLS